MRQTSKIILPLLVFALAAGVCQPAACADAAGAGLSKKTIRLQAGKTETLKVKGTKKKAKWSVKTGKKIVKLQAKKKASVKVKALKPGTAKVQCQAGKKKLICKITVTEKGSGGKDISVSVAPTDSNALGNPSVGSSVPPAPTDSNAPLETSASPSAEPTATIFDRYAYELKTRYTPGPTAEYDRLKVETGLYKNYLHPEYHFLPGFITWAEMQFFETGIWRDDIEQIHISDSKTIPEAAIGSFDLSEKQNGSVMAWYTDEDQDGRYEMTIGQDGGVVANENSGYLFTQIRNREKRGEGGEPFLTGIENLDTSHVVNMEHMFEFADDCTGRFSLGDNFNTSLVTDMKYMFYSMCYGTLEELHLGAQFFVEDSVCASFMFCDTGAGSRLKCYVKDEATKEWFVARKNSTYWHIGVLANETFSPDNSSWGIYVEP